MRINVHVKNKHPAIITTRLRIKNIHLHGGNWSLSNRVLRTLYDQITKISNFCIIVKHHVIKRRFSRKPRAMIISRFNQPYIYQPLFQ